MYTLVPRDIPWLAQPNRLIEAFIKQSTHSVKHKYNILVPIFWRRFFEAVVGYRGSISILMHSLNTKYIYSKTFSGLLALGTWLADVNIA